MRNAELIKAWLSGETLQVKMLDREQWIDFPEAEKCSDIVFSDNQELRLKSTVKKTTPVWRYIAKEETNGVINYYVYSTYSSTAIPKSVIFVKWLDDPSGPGYCVEF